MPQMHAKSHHRSVVELAKSLAAKQRACDDATVEADECQKNLADCHQVTCCCGPVVSADV